MLYLVVVLFCLTAFSCREIQPLSTSIPISGYQLNGTVTTLNGIPIDSVEVNLFYYYAMVDTTPVDTQTVMVTDSTKILDISVYTPTYHFIRTIFLGYRHTGPVPRAQWDGRDWNGTLMPSGKYLIRYLVDTTIVKFSPIVIEGNRTAVTDIRGRFSITNDNLPIGDRFDMYYMDGTFDAVYKILPKIGIVLRKKNLHGDYSSINLEKDKITIGSYTL